MRSLLHRTILRTSRSHFLILRPPLSPMATTASSSFLLPSVSLNNLPCSKNASFCFAAKNLNRSRVSMSVSAGSQSTTVHDSLFADYKPTSAFLFPGQVTSGYWNWIWIVVQCYQSEQWKCGLWWKKVWWFRLNLGNFDLPRLKSLLILIWLMWLSL